MKNLSHRLCITFLFLAVSANLLSGQSNRETKQIDHTEFSLSKTINLNGESDQIEVTIPISDNKVALSILIASIVWAGELTIEVYDPTGEKLGNYSVGSQNSIKTNKTGSDPTKKETVTGQITKTVEFPITGNWKVLIIPKNAKGTLDIKSNQISMKR